ncbi:HEAT repeat domain-containing protein [Candidatus Eisenbacteria bacterium]|uniref:HEAT repeat domain-containing protein n=1 Tax=Eiseniibacteriota bacterium TaxID=2212470 RepID=A0ABV6YI16_UNCEI
MANPICSSTKDTIEARSSRPEVEDKGNGREVIQNHTMIGEGLPEQIREPVRAQIDLAMESDELEVLVACLVAVSRRRAPSEGESLKGYIFKRLLSRVLDSGERRKLWPVTRLSAARPEVEARQMCSVLLDAYWRDHRKEVERLTLNLARDEDREVRQYAAGTMARIIRGGFRSRLRYLQGWSRHPDPSVRRQVLIATVGVADPEHPERAKALLDLLEPHLSDRDPYVRRNLGPFALGQGLLQAYPEATLVRFQEWLKSEDEVVRWNLAMGLAAAVAVSEWKAALEVLRVLAADQRRFVWGAASAALGNLANHRSREVGPVLRRWMRDPQLRVAVSSALRGVPR